MPLFMTLLWLIAIFCGMGISQPLNDGALQAKTDAVELVYRATDDHTLYCTVGGNGPVSASAAITFDLNLSNMDGSSSVQPGALGQPSCVQVLCQNNVGTWLCNDFGQVLEFSYSTIANYVGEIIQRCDDGSQIVHGQVFDSIPDWAQANDDNPNEYNILLGAC
ncbi:hypothetical protein F5Y16DRAFT_400578 [Xylariaceae sp. FL0255]|nr:hypothetical protein F5Y16DRAFT_400578 [Xylariaceae sp. FL0255]